MIQGEIYTKETHSKLHHALITCHTHSELHY